MNSLTELVKKMSLINYDVGSSTWVDVTHINNPHSFYVRPTAYRIYLSALQSYSDQITPSDVVLQGTVIFKSQTKNDFIRGQILFVGEGEEMKCDLIAQDYGFMEKDVPLEHIRKTEHDVDIPMLAVHCQLADCKPPGETWTEKTIEAMKYFVKDERAKMVVRGKTADQLTVELINSCPDDIATLLALTGYSTLGYGENFISRLTVPEPDKYYYTHKQLKIGDTLHIRVQSGISLDNFYVTELKDYKRYLNERSNVTYFSKKQPSLNIDDFKKNKPVSVFVDATNNYERGIIKNITVPNTKATVQLIDWGNTTELHISKMKAMSEKFIQFPAIAIWCSTEERDIWDNGLHKFLYPGFEFVITVKEIGNRNVPNIVKISPLP